jgi:hypothetical protein
LLASSSDSDADAKQLHAAPAAKAASKGGELQQQLGSPSFSIGSSDDSMDASALQDSAPHMDSPEVDRSELDSGSEMQSGQHSFEGHADATSEVARGITAQEDGPAGRRGTKSSMGASKGTFDYDLIASSSNDSGEASPPASRKGSNTQATAGKRA